MVIALKSTSRMMRNVIQSKALWVDFKIRNTYCLNRFNFRCLRRLVVRVTNDSKFGELHPDVAGTLRVLRFEVDRGQTVALHLAPLFKFSQLRKLYVEQSQGVHIFNRRITDDGYANMRIFSSRGGMVNDPVFWKHLSKCYRMQRLRLLCRIPVIPTTQYMWKWLNLHYLEITTELLEAFPREFHAMVRHTKSTVFELKLVGDTHILSMNTLGIFFDAEVTPKIRKFDYMYQSDLWDAFMDHCANDPSVVLHVQGESINVYNAVTQILDDAGKLDKLNLQICGWGIELPEALSDFWAGPGVRSYDVECTLSVDYHLSISVFDDMDDVNMFLSDIVTAWRDAVSDTPGVIQTNMEHFKMLALIPSDDRRRIKKWQHKQCVRMTSFASANVAIDIEFQPV